MTYQRRPFAYAPPPGLSGAEPKHPVVIVGAGPVGLAMALELAGHRVPSVVLDAKDVVSAGSRAICWSKRSLEILDRLGIGQRCLDKGVTWQTGRTYHRAQEVFRVDLQPEDGHRMPAFVNLQQYYVEEYLAEAAQASPLIDLRFRNRVTAIEQSGDQAIVDVRTPDGEYALQADYVLACDGAGSPLRRMLGLAFTGERFEERFLIADIEMATASTSDRQFWFEPVFHPGQSALLHKQPDNLYRIDLQLGPGADPEQEARPETVRPRIRKVLGHDDFRLDWVSVYRFQCRRLRSFVHGRVVFAGDSAHVVSPFGARGGNGGLQDVDALGWRLAAVLDGRAGAGILAAYDRERCFAADENLRASSRTTRFMTPKGAVERLFRDEVLALSGRAEFARAWVNSGRLSQPCTYPLEAADHPSLPPASRPGSVAPDAPLDGGWLLPELAGRVTLLAIGQTAPELDGAVTMACPATPHVRTRYLGTSDRALYLIRPDQVVAARWVHAGPATLAAAVRSIWEDGT